jgi:hypothetical protein
VNKTSRGASSRKLHQDRFSWQRQIRPLPFEQGGDLRLGEMQSKPTTAADLSGFTSSLSVFTANTVNR